MKQIKRMIAIATIGAVVFLTGCTSSSGKTPPTKDVADAVLAAVEFPEMTDNSTKVSSYYAIDPADLKEVTLYICGSAAYPDEVLVARAADKSKVSDIKKAIIKRRDDQSDLYKDYATAEQMEKINTSVIKVIDDYVFFAMSADNTAALEAFNQAFQ